MWGYATAKVGGKRYPRRNLLEGPLLFDRVVAMLVKEAGRHTPGSAATDGLANDVVLRPRL